MVKIQKQQIGKDKTLIKLTSDTSRRDLIRNFWTYINYGNSVCIRKGIDIEEYSSQHIPEPSMSLRDFKITVSYPKESMSRLDYLVKKVSNLLDLAIEIRDEEREMNNE